MELQGDITQLLHRWRDGDRQAENELFQVVMPKLRGLARHFMQGERKDHLLQPTELIDQIYLRLVAAKNRDWQNRQHFFAIAARMMRRHLIDYAKSRPHVEFTPLDGFENFFACRDKLELAVTMDRLLKQLSKTRPEWCTVVEMKHFLGFTDEEVAQAAGISVRTIKRHWHHARLWLFERIGSDNAGV